MAAAAVVQLPASDDGLDDGLVTLTIEELRAADRLRTSKGQLAVKTARLIDGSTAVMGMAALMKEWRSQMDDALAGVAIQADEVDEITARREAKLRLAAGG